MRLRKDDPVYWRNEQSKLIAKAEENGIEVYLAFDLNQKPRITFHDIQTGEAAGAVIQKKNQRK